MKNELKALEKSSRNSISSKEIKDMSESRVKSLENEIVHLKVNIESETFMLIGLESDQQKRLLAIRECVEESGDTPVKMCEDIVWAAGMISHARRSIGHYKYLLSRCQLELIEYLLSKCQLELSS